MNANEIHSIDHINGKPNSKAITLLIPYEFLQTQINNFKYVWYQISLDSDHQEIFDEILTMGTIARQQDSDIRHLHMMASIYKVLYLLQKNFSTSRPVPNNLDGTDNQQIFEHVIQYLAEHFREPITLGDVAKTTHLSVGYLSRLFSKEMGITLMHYLSLIRLHDAYSLLNNSDKSIESIADLSGFPNEKSFRKTFISVYDMTPLQYRNQFR